MFTFPRKVVHYIRTKFFKKPLTYEECVVIAARNIRDAIDRDVLRWVYKEAMNDNDKY
jgi:hypothetical protein